MGFKAAAVLTDMPLKADKPVDFGLQDFCRHCKICAEMCPSQAIPMGDKTMHNGYQTWKIDEQRCASFGIMNKRGTICGRCVRVCPWNRPYTWPHTLVRWGVERSGLARRFAIRADHALGRGAVREDEKWWFDLEDVDGVLTIPQ
jgi:epoxyqueuosine reductase QueG